MKNVVAQILAGGAGERLYPLTKNRAKPAVPFGGIYRIIDFTLSNCINSGVRRIQLLAQYESLSLARHVRLGWGLLRSEFDEYIEVVPPQKRVGDSWYLGTADAVYQNIYSLERDRPTEVLILAGDHVYKMDYSKMIAFHRRMNADLTVPCIQVAVQDAKRFGVMEVDADSRIVRFEEKPVRPTPSCERDDRYLASMGIYVFACERLKEVLADDAMNSSSSHDFGKDIVPKMVGSARAFAYSFADNREGEPPYWRDIGTIDAYWEANMDLVAVTPTFNLYEPTWPIRTHQPQHPPAKFVFADIGERYGVALDSIVSHGCIISGGVVKNSVLSRTVRVNSYATVERSILFDGAEVGRRCRIENAIVEEGVHIPPGTVIGSDPTEDVKRHFVTDGGVVVLQTEDFGAEKAQASDWRDDL